MYGYITTHGHQNIILPNISLTSDFCQSVISCFINNSFYTFVFKINLERVTEFSRSTAYFMRIYFTWKNLCDNSETDLGSTQISERINYVFLARTARVRTPVDARLMSQCSFPDWQPHAIKLSLSFHVDMKFSNLLLREEDTKCWGRNGGGIMVSERP